LVELILTIYKRICSVCETEFYCLGKMCDKDKLNNSDIVIKRWNCYCPKHIRVFSIYDCNKYASIEEALAEDL